MVVPHVPTESEIARQVLAIVAHHRWEGLVRENEALVAENRRLVERLDARDDNAMEMESTINDLSVTLSQLIQENGANGIPRPDIRASHRVCAFCFDFLVVGTGWFRCNCQEYAYCSRECQNIHWGRHHKYTCPARIERYPQRPYDP